MSNAPDPKNASEEDFIKGWPARYLLERKEFVDGLAESHGMALREIGSTLNYGTLEEGAWMKGHPNFIDALSVFLSDW